jgi:hypothetical protein
MTFYHGTVSTVEKSILKHGIRKSKENGFVWMATEFRDAVSHAQIRATEAKAPIGSTLNYHQYVKGGLLGGTFRLYTDRKSSGRVDPTAQPIVFEIDLPDSWLIEESPNAPGQWRVPRKIPPSMLSIIRLNPNVPYAHPIEALKGLHDSLQDIQATLLRGMARR